MLQETVVKCQKCGNPLSLKYKMCQAAYIGTRQELNGSEEGLGV
jgi:hypothetical protein